MVVRFVLLSIIVVLAGCGGEDNAAPNDRPEPIPISVTVWNRSQFELLDVRVHSSSSYAYAPNLLSEPLAVEGRIDVQLYRGDRITVIRRKVEVGDTIALTTGRGLTDATSGSTLVVFDEAFRLMPPGAP